MQAKHICQSDAAINDMFLGDIGIRYEVKVSCLSEGARFILNGKSCSEEIFMH